MIYVAYTGVDYEGYGAPRYAGESFEKAIESLYTSEGCNLPDDFYIDAWENGEYKGTTEVYKMELHLSTDKNQTMKELFNRRNK